jgi:hypothetical protein
MVSPEISCLFNNVRVQLAGDESHVSPICYSVCAVSPASHPGSELLRRARAEKSADAACQCQFSDIDLGC